MEKINIYVPDKDYKIHNAVFIQKTLVLHAKNGAKDKEIRILSKPKDSYRTSCHLTHSSAIESFSSQYDHNDEAVQQGKDGQIAELIDGVMSAHEDAQNRPEEESINILAFSIIPFKEALNSDV